jgi:hypothetical protein
VLPPLECATVESPIRLDEVSIFNHKLRFFIPHHWVEGEDEADTFLYHAPGTDSGWLRVSLITAQAADPNERLQALLPMADCLLINEANGNRVKRSEKRSHEDGSDLHIYNWIVGNAVLPNRVFEAVFSYTILAERINDRETKQTVELLEGLVSQAVFSNGLQ